MGTAVRTVCVSCLHSAEFSGDDTFAGCIPCPNCGRPVEVYRPGVGSDNPTTGGDPFPSSFDPDALTPDSVVERATAPDRIGRFLVRERLGEGGYGQVFRAFDPHLERDVALKVLKPDRLGEKALERFFREARAAARLDHPNIVGLHEAGRDDGRCWIAFQLVPGRTLAMIRDVDPPSVDEAARIVRDLALALDHAHRRGIYHRDLKPSNVLVDESGRARLTDFGLARRGDLDSDLTMEGTILGTPQYMSPEAAAGRAYLADGRSDVYSLGVILFELLRGRKPSDGPSEVPLWKSARLASPPAPRADDRPVPEALDRACQKALAIDPDDRFPDARSFADALTGHLLDGGPTMAVKAWPRSRRRGVAAVVAALAVLLAVGVVAEAARRASTGREPTALGADPLRNPADVLRPPASSPGPERSGPMPPAARPEVVSPSDEVWDQPVVWFRKTDGLKFHKAANGCAASRKLSATDRAVPLGDGGTASRSGYIPCGNCFRGVMPPVRQ